MSADQPDHGLPEWSSAEGATTPRLPDLDQPPAPPEEVSGLRARFACVGPSSDAFPAVVTAAAIFLSIIAVTTGFVGQLAAAAAGVATWILCVRIHVTPQSRVWVHATEAAVIGIVLLIS